MSSREEIIKVLKTIKVLYVEDEESIRDGLKNNLSNFFERFECAIDGVDGLEQFKNSEFDIIVTDIEMPNLNGLAMVEEIREIDKNIPIVIVTAFNQVRYLEKALELSVDGYISKPFKAIKLLDRIYKASMKVLNKRLESELKTINLNLKDEVEKRVAELRIKDSIMLKQSRYALMGEMVDAIAHQWRQPINAISLIAIMMEDRCEEGDIDKNFCFSTSKKISTQIEHLEETLEEFRNFFRKDKIKTNFNLKNIINSIFLLIKDEFSKNKINFIFKLEDKFIDGYENELKHVLLNVINNSKDAFIDNDIKDKIIEIETSKDKNVIYIRDNAGGINEEIIDNIFELNFTTKREKGTGIGLYLSKVIINKMGGNLSVKNINGGVEFTISL